MHRGGSKTQSEVLVAICVAAISKGSRRSKRIRAVAMRDITDETGNHPEEEKEKVQGNQLNKKFTDPIRCLTVSRQTGAIQQPLVF